MILPRQIASAEVAERAGRDAQDAADEGAGEEVAVLGDGEVVGRRGEDLGEGVGGADEEGLRGRSMRSGISRQPEEKRGGLERGC